MQNMCMQCRHRWTIARYLLMYIAFTLFFYTTMSQGTTYCLHHYI